MPTCKKCNSYFPITAIINGARKNLQRRKYCLVCSPFGKHNTQKLHLTTDEAEAKSRPIVSCRVCGRVYMYTKNKGHTLDRCNSCGANYRKIAIKEKMVNYKGGKCVVCGYNRCASALDFHHMDASEKGFLLSGSHCYSWEKIKAELDKCVCLCCRCHRELHAGLINLGV